MPRKYRFPEERRERISISVRKFWSNLSSEERQQHIAKIVSKRPIKLRRRDRFSAETLKNLYYNQNLSLPKMARQMGCTAWEIEDKMKDFNLPRRSISEALILVHKQNRAQGFSTISRWRGWSPKKTPDGYIRVVDPRLFPEKVVYMMEHRLIWEQSYGSLPKGWTIHHLNGIKDDNRKENLAAMPDRCHKRILSAKGERIRQLEAKLKELEKTNAYRESTVISRQ